MSFFDELSAMTDREIREGIIVGRWNEQRRVAARDELMTRMQNKQSKISEESVKATKYLVFATWGLVAITAILGLIAYMKQ